MVLRFLFRLSSVSILCYFPIATLLSLIAIGVFAVAIAKFQVATSKHAVVIVVNAVVSSKKMIIPPLLPVIT